MAGMVGALVLAALIAVAPAPAEDPATAQAKKLFVLGTTNFELGRFDEALKSYLEAYQKKPLPGFLFNIGLCQRKLGDHAAAAAAFEQYLVQLPKAANRADVEQMLAEERRAAAAMPAPVPVVEPPLPTAPPPAPPPTPEEPLAQEVAPAPVAEPDDAGVWLWAAAGGAVLVAAAGTVAAVALLAPPAATAPPPAAPLARIDLRSP